MGDPAGRRLGDQILLLPAHAERDVAALHAPLGDGVPLVDVALLAIVDDAVAAVVGRRQHGRIGEEVVLEGRQRLRGGWKRRGRQSTEGEYREQAPHAVDMM